MLLQHVLPPICDGLGIGWLPNRMDQVWRSTNDELRANLGVDGQDDWPDAFDPRGNAMLSDNTPLPDREELRLVRQAIVLAAECMRDPVWLARLIRRDGSCRGALIAMCRYMKESVFVDRRTPPADNEVTFKEMASFFDVVAGELVEADLLSLNELPQEPPPESAARSMNVRHDSPPQHWIVVDEIDMLKVKAQAEVFDGLLQFRLAHGLVHPCHGNNGQRLGP